MVLSCSMDFFRSASACFWSSSSFFGVGGRRRQLFDLLDHFLILLLGDRREVGEDLLDDAGRVERHDDKDDHEHADHVSHGVHEGVEIESFVAA